jgi:chromate reductase, NAD(P)H dehydrogenase (quinone)
MHKVLVFAGSTSKNSINKRLTEYAASLLISESYEVIDLNDYPLPIFSVDAER